MIDLELMKDHLIAYKEELELMSTPNRNKVQFSQEHTPVSSSNTGTKNRTSKEKNPDNRKIFIVHGQDEKIKGEVEEFLISIDLEPIILHKQASLGKTIIEKVEHYSDVGFAVILLTKDDFGGVPPREEDYASLRKLTSNSSQQLDTSKNPQLMSEYVKFIQEILLGLKPRARQNVIFEFGYFIGLLGRGRVAALCEDNIERPSDIDGLLYTPLDQGGEWKKKLAKEIDAAGIKIDEKFL
jgi:predicted nucleotide-binding protein